MSPRHERGMEAVVTALTLGPQVAATRSERLLRLPLVSVVITNFNYRDYVADAIQSAFGQTYPNVEIVVVDDVSTDDSVAVITEAIRGRDNAKIYRRVINGGQGAAMLDGLRASTGDFICFLDADDILLPDF